MFGVEALPLLYAFSQSERASERALFARICMDVFAERRRRGETPPQDWIAALQSCIAKAEGPERELYLSELAAALTFGEAAPEDEAPVAQGQPARRRARATRDDIDVILRQGGLEEGIALARDRLARLRPEHVETLVVRARYALSESGDARLAEALLARDPVRLEVAPLFLEAAPKQRMAILLAAQRADLGRKAAEGAPRLNAAETGRLEFAAIAGDSAEFAELLGAALGADAQLAARIADDPHGEPLAVALVALGAPRDVCVRILTARDMQDGGGFPRIQTLARLSSQLSAGAARRIVAALVGAPAEAASSLPASTSRQARNPSPFARRDAPARKTGGHQPRNDRNVGAK